MPPIVPPQDGFLLLDPQKFAASFAANVEPGLANFMAESQVPWGLEALTEAEAAGAILLICFYSISAMSPIIVNDRMTRRELLQRSATGAAALAAGIALPGIGLPAIPEISASEPKSTAQLYADTLKVWCDGLLARQVTEMRDPAFYGGLLCPACALIHGRSGDDCCPQCARRRADLHADTDAFLFRP